jgi:hypothetical protein
MAPRRQVPRQALEITKNQVRQSAATPASVAPASPSLTSDLQLLDDLFGNLESLLE